MVINGQHVYPSAIDGIGYALSFQCAGGPMRAIDGSHSAGGESVVVCDSATLPALMTQQQTTVRIAVTFYKTERCNWRTGRIPTRRRCRRWGDDH